MSVTPVTVSSVMVPARRMLLLLISQPQYPRKLSEKPITYRLTLNESPTKRASPSVPPIGSPMLRDNMKYVPPACTFLSVAIEATLSPVATEMMCATTMMAIVVHNPAWPTIVGRRRYMITPRIVRIDGVKTPAKVPNFFAPAIFWVRHRGHAADATERP